MLDNEVNSLSWKLIIKGKELSVCPEFPVWTILLGNQIWGSKYFCPPDIWKGNDRTRISLFATPSELIDLDIEHQQQLTSQKGRK